MVYDDAEELYAEVFKDGADLLDEAFDILFPPSVALPSSSPQKPLNCSGDIVAFNTTFFPRQDIIQVPMVGSLKAKFASMSPDAAATQSSKDGNTGYILMACAPSSNIGMPSGLSPNCNPASGSH